MSSMFVDAEVALADLTLAVTGGDDLDVVVGGLGLGYTAEAALRNDRVGELLVVDALGAVIRWHQEEKVPLGRVLNEDPRCRYIHGSFFDLAHPDQGFDPDHPGRLFDAILLDIDHSPRALLNESNASFYNADSLALMGQQLKPGGMFGMWSNEPPDEDFLAVLEQVFLAPEARVVSFFNPFQNKDASNTIYLARAAGDADQ